MLEFFPREPSAIVGNYYRGRDASSPMIPRPRNPTRYGDFFKDDSGLRLQEPIVIRDAGEAAHLDLSRSVVVTLCGSRFCCSDVFVPPSVFYVVRVLGPWWRSDGPTVLHVDS